MRIVKQALERKNEIIAAADRLFADKGYDNTSINDILCEIGIAKGTFYYYFKSKEELMDAIINKYCVDMFANAEQIANDSKLSVHDKILKAIISLNIKGKSGEEIVKHINKPQNALMHEKVNSIIINEVTKIITKIVMEGIDNQIFNTAYPYEAVEMIIIYVQIAFDGSYIIMTKDEEIKRIQAFIYNLGRLLGAEKGSFDYVMQLFNQNGELENEQ